MSNDSPLTSKLIEEEAAMELDKELDGLIGQLAEDSSDTESDHNGNIAAEVIKETDWTKFDFKSYFTKVPVPPTEFIYALDRFLEAEKETVVIEQANGVAPNSLQPHLGAVFECVRRSLVDSAYRERRKARFQNTEYKLRSKLRKEKNRLEKLLHQTAETKRAYLEEKANRRLNKIKQARASAEAEH